MKVEAMQSVTYRFSKSPPLLDVLSLLSFALFLYPFLMTVGTGLRWLEVPGTEWIKSHGAEGIALFWLYLAAAAASGGAFVLILVWKSPTRNFVLLDDVGLTTAFMGMRRRWPWRALESAEVEQTGMPLKTVKLTVSGTFGWMDRLALLFVNGLASSSRVTIRLPDFYEVPIEEVAARINEYRSAALGERRASEDAQQARKEAIAVPGQPVIFARSTVMYRRLRVVEYIIYALMVPLVGALAYLIYLDEDAEWHKLWPAGAAFFGFAVVMIVISSLLQKRAIQPEYNNLRLDEDSLVYMRAGKSLRWPWGELSDFKVRFASSKLLMGRRRFITFAAPGTDWTWGLLRRVHGLPKDPPLVIIEDIYETSLEDIAATLNAYRERALGGGNAAGDPQAPEQV
jgi:hypothetical protein